jgi:hypothetical protein
MNKFVHPTKKLGKRAPCRDTRMLRMADYLTPKLPPPPVRGGYVTKVSPLGMFLNDSLGDCTCAAAGHMIQQWTAYAGNQVILPDSAILKAYCDVGGYVPGDPSTDNGAVILDVLKYWKKTGIGGHKIAAFVSVNYSNPVEVAQAIKLFGNVDIGVQLPTSAQNDANPVPGGLPLWSVPPEGLNGDGSPGSWGGHSVLWSGYALDPTLIGLKADPTLRPGVELITWGAVYAATQNFCNCYVDEMYAVVTKDWIEANGKSPSGFDITTLMADMQSVR